MLKGEPVPDSVSCPLLSAARAATIKIAGNSDELNVIEQALLFSWCV